MKYDTKVLKNIYDETSELYEQIYKLFEKRYPEKIYDEPMICQQIRCIDDDVTSDIDEFYKCQINNKLTAYSILLGIIYLPYDEPDSKIRNEMCMKYALLNNINKRKTFTFKTLHKLLISFPINTEIPISKIESFYNKLMEE